jgi:hypothetical protein
MAVLLHHETRKLTPPDDEDLLVVLLQFLDERDEVAVAAHDDKGVDVVVGERHFECIEREIDVGAVLVAARRQVALHHANGMLRQEPAVVAGALPVAVGDLGDDFTALLDGFENGRNIERLVQSGLDADLDVVEINEDRDFQLCVCQGVLFLPILDELRSAIQPGRSQSRGIGHDLPQRRTV